MRLQLTSPNSWRSSSSTTSEVDSRSVSPQSTSRRSVLSSALQLGRRGGNDETASPTRDTSGIRMQAMQNGASSFLPRNESTTGDFKLSPAWSSPRQRSPRSPRQEMGFSFFKIRNELRLASLDEFSSDDDDDEFDSSSEMQASFDTIDLDALPGDSEDHGSTTSNSIARSPAKHCIPEKAGIVPFMINTDDPTGRTLWIRVGPNEDQHLQLNITSNSQKKTRRKFG